MKDLLQRYFPQISKDIRKLTSLRESEDGQKHCGLQDGHQTDLFGQDHRPANPSVQQETGKDRQTSDTYGLYFSISLESVHLQQSLESKLRQQLEHLGSTIYKLTWREKATPQGWWYSQRVASVPRTKETDCSTLPTDAWPTPTSWDAQRGPAKLTEDGHRVSKAGVRYGISLVTAAHQSPLSMMIHSVTSGKEDTTFSAETGKRVKYQLNHRFSLWLMGYPIEWAYCAERVTLSSPR